MLCQASITLFLKNNKDSRDCSSYRPISLTNCDVKVFSKVIALQLETILPHFISGDQTGFIQGRQSYFNLRWLFNIINTESSTPSPEAVISFDAEKKLDRVEWNRLFHTFSRFGFGPNFIQLIKLIYTDPTTSVYTNDISSGYFPLHRGTKQGDPVSPLLFVLAIEPLAIALRCNNSALQCKGTSRGDLTHTVSLYAEDLLLYVTNPITSTPKILSLAGIWKHIWI